MFRRKSRQNKQAADSGMSSSRRQFLKIGAFTGGAALLGSCSYQQIKDSFQGSGDYPYADPENILYSVCLQCNTGCGIKVKVHNGVAVKVDGNPRAPQTLWPHLPYETSPFMTAAIDGALCPKGQAGLQTVYDPYRIRTVLKRAGKRGENRWVSIPFDQAIQEIVQGGQLFKHVPGEENRYVSGLQEIWALRDPQVAQAMAADVAALKKIITSVRSGQQPESAVQDAIRAFQQKHREHLDTLIDPDHPDLGPKNNQLVFNWGRLKAGRGDFIQRFVRDAFGSVNAHGHTTVCQGSLYFTGKAMSEQWVYDAKARTVKWTGGKKFYWQADTGNARFILFVGASPFEGNYGPPGRSVRITQNIVEGRQRIVVVDPRFSKTASKAWKWLPIKPGTEAALALAMIRWIIENNRYDVRYLANANKAAAQSAGEPTWCNATWLVVIDEDGQPGKFLRAHELDLAPVQQRKTEDGSTYDYELFVVLRNGKPVAVDPNDDTQSVEGDLLVDTTLRTANGQSVQVKSSLQLLYESTQEHTVEEWAQICGLEAADIVAVAREFTSHGKRAVADIHRGVSQHTNGFYNCFAFNALNLLIGNYDWQGGFISASVWNITGDHEHQPFMFKSLHPGKLNAFGVTSIRHDMQYEETTLFTGYPARRPWYPLSSDIYQEVIPSIGDQYPYPVKCLILYMGSPVYALPGGNELIPILMDTEKLPLFIANDIVVGETSMYADYIFPDLSYLERWEFHGSHPSFSSKIQPIRQPTIAPIPETVSVAGVEMPISLETMLLALGVELGLPGFGKDGFASGEDFTHFDQYYLKMVANVAAGDKPGQEVPDASDEEVALFLQARRHLPRSVFEVERWKQACGEAWWRKVVYVLNRGGRFENFDQAYVNEQVRNKYGKLVNLYSEKAATATNGMTPTLFSGIPRFFPPYTDCMGNPINDEGHDLRLITFRDITTTKSRTISNYWLLNILPENVLLLNRLDAERLRLHDGDSVRVRSVSNPDGEWDLGHGNRRQLILSVKVIEGIRPGTASFAVGFGHWAYGANDIIIDGERIQADPQRARGTHLNAAMRTDPVLKNTALTDQVGASVVFFETLVKLERV